MDIEMKDVSTVSKVQKKKYRNQTLSKCIKKLYLDSDTADGYFAFDSDDGSPERVPIHKFLLTTVSDVFKAMFNGKLKENGDVKITDATASAYKEFLQFFYLDHVRLTEENVVEVMNLGHKYNVVECTDVCVQFLKDTLTDDNVCIALDLAILYERKDLMKSCKMHIIRNTSAVFKSKGFLNCNKQVLAHILKMSLLSGSEVEVFEACMSWVKSQSNQDHLTKGIVMEHLGDLFYEIRFKSMTMEQFVALAASYKSILSNDFEVITNMIVLPEIEPNPRQSSFNKNPRHPSWNTKAVIKCNRVVAGTIEENFDLNQVEETTFTANKPILLGGFVFQKVGAGRWRAIDNLRKSLKIHIEVIESANSKTKDGTTLSDMIATIDSKETEFILLEPVLIRPGFFYTIKMSGFPDLHRFYSKSLMTEVQMNPNINIEFNNNITDIDGNTVALISALLFNRLN